STDPVAPYSTGEPCGAQVCEPTRVREGIQFELRCRDTGKAPETLITRLLQCLGNPKDFGKTARDSMSLYIHGQTISSAMRAQVPEISLERVRDYSEGELVPAVRALQEETNRLRAGIQPSSEAQSTPETTPDAVLAAAQKVISLTARFYTQPEERRQA